MDKFAADQSPLPEFLIGNVAGLRSATAPAVVAWVSGAAVAVAARRSGVRGALLGAAGGIAGAYAGHRLRTRLPAALHVSDAAIAAVEDVVAIGGARSIVTKL